MRRWAWINFVVSVWVLIGFCVVNAVDLLGQTERMHAAYGPFAARAMLWPVAIATVEGLLWWRVFRHRGSGTRLWAAFMGLFLLLQPLLVSVLVADLYDRPADPLRLWLFAYVAISHLLQAVVGPDDHGGP